MMYAFSRDGALPGSKFFQHVDPTTKTPVRTGKNDKIFELLKDFIVFPVWLAVILSFMLGLPSLGSQVAFSAATSIATIGLYISYGINFSLWKTHTYS
jgi:amino acid transporter